MKIRRRSSPLWLLILVTTPLISSTSLPQRDFADSAARKQVAKADAAIVSLPSIASKSNVDGVGTKDAPVDGKDGRPHLGPFVETSAERDRKKAKENGEDTVVQKPLPTKEIPHGASSGDGWTMPETNDGVMDDPNRTRPKEGTRGTEGGITEKSKDRKESSLDSTKSEKKPDPPKEIPPLPHSEETSLPQKSTKDDGRRGKDAGADGDDKKKDDKKNDDRIKEPGGLEVVLIV